MCVFTRKSWWNKKLIYRMSQEVFTSVALRVWTPDPELVKNATFGSSFRPTESEMLGGRLSSLCCNKPSKSLMHF